MSHSYTPGLKVLHQWKLKKERRLPIKGTVNKSKGDKVIADDIVAKTDLPGNVHMVKISNILNISPSNIHDYLIKGKGETIKKGDIIAQSKGLFGYFKSEVQSPSDGTIESVSDVTGQIVIRESPIPIEVDAYVEGVITKVIDYEGVTVESDAAYVQGIFGIGGESRGSLQIVVKNRGEEIDMGSINESHSGKIIVGGSFVSLEAYKKAIDLNVKGIVVGGFNYFDLEEILGYTLGVAITGTEELETSLIVTEGYGNIKMSERTFNLLSNHDGKFVSVNGATQIRAGVIRPEIVIPLTPSEISDNAPIEKRNIGIEKGAIVRVIRAPYFGKIGEVEELPAELQKMESETMVRVAKVRIDSESFIIPRSNLEMLEMD